jgi:hypothetical protein
MPIILGGLMDYGCFINSQCVEFLQLAHTAALTSAKVSFL